METCVCGGLPLLFYSGDCMEFKAWALVVWTPQADLSIAWKTGVTCKLQEEITKRSQPRFRGDEVRYSHQLIIVGDVWSWRFRGRDAYSFELVRMEKQCETQVQKKH